MTRIIVCMIGVFVFGVIYGEILNGLELFNFRVNVYLFAGSVALIYLFSELIYGKMSERGDWMNPVVAVIGASVLISFILLGLSLLWFFFISRSKGTYVFQILSIAGSSIGFIVLFGLSQTADMAITIAYMFIATFIFLPVFVGSLISGIILFFTRRVLLQK